MAEVRAFNPDWISAPGDTIADILEERSLSQAELAERTGLSKKHINDLVKARVAITADVALRLERVLGASAEFWLTREARYQEAKMRREQVEALVSEAGWLDELPLADMVKFGWVAKFKHLGEQVAECLRFFAVANVEAWRSRYGEPMAAFRASEKHEKRPGAVAAWLRQGERLAEDMATAPFDRAAFHEALATVRALTREADPAVFVPRLQEICAATGVAVVFVPAPKGCPASGATRYLSPDKAMLLLSLRHKTNDHLWFTFFHEAGHLYLHGKKVLFVDLEGGLDGELEDEADRFSRDLLIPPHRAREPATFKSAAEVEGFAEEIGIAPGIVVGRMQKEKWLPWHHLNKLKVRYTWGTREGADA